MANNSRRYAIFACAILSVLCVVEGSFARSKRYIVKIASHPMFEGQALKGNFRMQAVRTANLMSVSREVSENIPGSHSVFNAKKFGMLIVQNDDNEELLRDALSRHPYVKYFEEDVEFRIDSLDTDVSANTDANRCNGTNHSGTRYCVSNPAPANLQLSPWFRDALGMDSPSSDGAGLPDSTIEMTLGALPTIVAVIDTGAMVEHPYLKYAIAKNNGEVGTTKIDSADDDSNGVVDDFYGASFTINGSDTLVASGDPTDVGTDHGTHVAGTIKSVRDHAIAHLSGSSAPRTVQILPIRFINESQVGSTSGAIASLEYAADRGAKVINCSWGAKGTEAFTQSLYDAMAEAYTVHDILIAIASGNAESRGPNNNDTTPYFPSSMSVPSIISVASVTPEYRSSSQSGGTMYALGLSDFSNYGANSVHIAAPGGYRDASGYSDGVYSANARLIDTTGAAVYIKKKGTSMATPVVAGVAAVVRALNPGLTSYEVKKLLMDTVSKSSNLRTAVLSGGTINAAAAYAAALSQSTRNEKPALPSDPYSTYTSTSSGTPVASGGGGGGGCGALLPVGQNSGGGPFGGNSLILFSTLYFVGFFIRLVRRLNKSRRV